VVHPDRRSEEAQVTQAISDEGPQAVFDRLGSLVEKRDEQRRGEPYDFPSEKDEIQRACKRDHGGPCAEKGKEKKEAQIPRFTMQVTPREGADQTHQNRGERDKGQ